MAKRAIEMAVLFSFLLAVGLVPGGAWADQINWHKYDQGLAKSKAQNKKIFLNFHADWCRYCLKMEKETFTNGDVITYMNEHFIPIMVDSDKEKQLAGQYNVRALPTSWFLEPNQSKISTLPGYVDAKQLLNILKYINTESYKKMSFKDFLMQ